MKSEIKYMFYWLKIIAFSLTGLSLFTGSMEMLSTPVTAGEAIRDNRCQYHIRTQEVFRKIPPQNRGTVFLTSGFDVNNQKYFLQVLKFPNSTSVFCLVKPNSPPQRLNQAQFIQDKLIEKIEKDSSRKANYIVTIRGDKNEKILKALYRLNLTNPNQPKVTPRIVMYK
jgi:hypothetical protein